MKRNEIKLGDHVCWKSQAGGCWATKFGTVIYDGPSTYRSIPPEGEGAWLDADIEKDVRESSRSRRRFDHIGDGLIIGVDVIERSSGTAQRFTKPRLHAPKAKQLTLVASA